MQLTFNETHTLHTRFCYSCRQWWAAVHETRGYCPYCAERRNAANDETEAKLVRRINALRGVVTRMKRRRRAQ